MTTPNKTVKVILLEYLLNTVYQKWDNQLKEKLNQIIWRFKQSNPNGIGGFQYKAEIYLEPNFTIHIGSRLPLLPRGEESAAMDAWLIEKKELAKEKADASNILSCALSKASSKADLLLLLPDGLHGALHGFPEYGKPSVTQEDAEAFHASAKPFLDMIRKRLLLNLIL